MKKITILFLTIMLGHGNVFAQTIITGGTVSGNWTQVNSPYIIQSAIMIPNDSTLFIEPGVKIEFQGNYKLLVLGRLLAIGSIQDSITFTAADTISGWFGIRFENTSSSNDTSKFYFCKLEYGKVADSPANNEGGVDNSGGAFYFDNFSKAIISNSLISNCTVSSHGGGIFCTNSSNPIISYNTISNNKATAGGGICCLFTSNPLISNNNISNNTATQWAGGGIYCHYNSSPNIIDNIISFNNCSQDRGGGISITGSSSLISNNVISYNLASGDLGGAGIYSAGGLSNEIISNNIISYNQTSNDLYDGGGGGIFCSGETTIINNIISNNISSNNGGGIICYNGGSPTLINNSISNNTSILGGALYLSSSNLQSINNTISNNSAQQGGALFCTSSSDPTITNTILWGNTASDGNQIYLDDDASDPNISYCDVQGGQSGIGVNSNVFYLGTYTDNIDADSIFISPSGGSGTDFNGTTANWSLQSTSPCIDSGNPEGTYPTTDLAGNPRVYGLNIDIGAYEFQGSQSVSFSNVENQIYIFPNPTLSQLYIENNRQKINSIIIIDITGKKIRTITKDLNLVNVVDLPSGIYFIKFISEKIILTKKFIKQ